MQKKKKINIKEVKKKIKLEEMTSKLVYLDNAATSLKTNKFIETLCKSYENCDWVSRKEEILASLFTELSELLLQSIENIALVPSSTYAINEIWGYILEKNKNKSFRIHIQQEDHISNISSIKYLKNNWTNNACKLNYFSPKGLSSLEVIANDVILITWMDNLGINSFVKRDIELLKEKNSDLIIIGDFTQFMPYWNREDNLVSLFDFFYFSAHKFFGPSGLGILVSTDVELPKSINLRKNYLLDCRSIYMFEQSLKELKALSPITRREKENQLKSYWLKNFPKCPNLTYLCLNDSLVFLVGFDSEYLHDFLYFLERKNIVFRSYDLCNNSSIVLNRQIRFSLSFLNSIDDLKILFDSIRQFFELKLG